MSFWIVIAAMAVAAVAALALPLFRGRAEDADPAEFDLEVYHDQIAELERDCERGVLTEAEMAAARTEIARRILAADARLKARSGQQDAGDAGPAGTVGAVVLAIALAIMVPLGALFLYLEVGQPGRPDMPLSTRSDLGIGTGGQENGLNQMIAELERAAKADPANPEPWLNLGLAYKQVERFRESADALGKAFALRPATPMLNSEYGESLVLASGGTVTPEARAAFEAVLAERPDDIRARHYLALGDYQAGRIQAALDRWAALIAISPADAPWLEVVREGLAQAARDLGLDVAEVMPNPLPPAEGSGLTAEQRAEMEAMSPEERETTIRGMIEELETSLAEDPMDLEGWEGLIRARNVMGEQDAAQAALDRALEAFAMAPFPKQRLASLGHELGLSAPAATSEADIAGMVERLAERLEREPDDLEGWLMLARSYTVMGQTEKARRAMATAAQLAPDDPGVLGLEADAIRTANGGQHNTESIAILRRVLELDPNHAQALWFVGNAEAEAGNTDDAVEMLERAYELFPADSEDRVFVRQRIEQIRGS
jgi:cytochrome c-type biogenesis protein CcmH